MPSASSTLPPIGLVKSMQRGTIDLVGQISQTATISAVDTSKAEITLLGWSGAGLASDTAANLNSNFPRITLTNATTVTATRQSNANPAGIVVSFQVTERPS